MGHFEMEFSLYKLVVSCWNERAAQQPPQEKLDFRPFMDYVMSVYDELEATREQVPPEAWPGIWNHWRAVTLDTDPLEAERSEMEAPAYWRQWLRTVHQVVDSVVTRIWVSHTRAEEEFCYAGVQAREP
jgi:hypothetical protein